MKEPKAEPGAGGQAPDAKNLTPGMAALLRKGNGEPKSEAQRQTPEAERNPAETRHATRNNYVMLGSLVLADVLLLILAAMLVAKSRGQVGFMEIAICVVALVLGAWLSCLAIFKGINR